MTRQEGPRARRHIGAVGVEVGIAPRHRERAIDDVLTAAVAIAVLIGKLAVVVAELAGGYMAWGQEPPERRDAVKAKNDPNAKGEAEAG